MSTNIYSIPIAGLQADGSNQTNTIDHCTTELFRLFHCDAKALVRQGGFQHIREDGKHVFDRPQIVHEHLTFFHVKAHLVGEYRVGAIPILANDTAKWGGIDVDLYGDSFDIGELLKRVDKLGLHLYVSMSKSGGAHIYIFLEEALAASTLRKILQNIAKALGLPKKHIEIYPKQDTISDKVSGNGMELPYCGMKYEGSVDTAVIQGHGGSLLLHEFLAIVKRTRSASLQSWKKAPARLPGSPGGTGPARDVNTLVNKLNNETRELLKEPHHTDRSKSLWTIIAEAVNKGFTDEEIASVLREYPNGPALHYTEKNTSLEGDIKRVREKYKRHSFNWPEETLLTKQGFPHQNVYNVALVLKSTEMDGLFTYDEMERKAKVTGSLPDVFNGEDQRQAEFPYTFRDADCIHMQAWFQTIGMRTIEERTVGQGIYLVSRDRSFHPVKEYLESLTWDDTSRLNDWLPNCLGVEKNEYHKIVGRKFLLQMIARIYRPGCKADYMMVLVGKQGKLKSMMASILAGKWFSDNLPNLRNEKDAALHLNGKWLVEIAELAAIRKQDVEHVKVWLVRQVDKYRPPYGKNDVDEPRQCVFFGTTNKEDFLNDETGARRYWPVTVVDINLEWLRTNRDQLFAEAKHLFDKGEEWWPSNDWLEKSAKVEQDKYQEDDVWEESIKKHVMEYGGKVRPTDICRNALGFKDEKEIKPADYNRIRKIMTGWKWEKRRDEKSTYWFDPKKNT